MTRDQGLHDRVDRAAARRDRGRTAEFLAEVPNPWLIGSGEPRMRDDRPTTTVLVAPKRSSYVSKQGEVFEHQFVK